MSKNRRNSNQALKLDKNMIKKEQPIITDSVLEKSFIVDEVNEQSAHESGTIAEQVDEITTLEAKIIIEPPSVSEAKETVNISETSKALRVQATKKLHLERNGVTIQLTPGKIFTGKLAKHLLSAGAPVKEI